MQQAEDVQASIVRLVASLPVGADLALIGGFRLRFLNGSCRLSRDIDYHASGDLRQKAIALAASLRESFLPGLRSRHGWQGEVSDQVAPGEYSPAMQEVRVRLWKQPSQAIVLPIEITTVPVCDPLKIALAGGTVLSTVSDADLIEMKMVAIFSRQVIEPRDFLDVHLFGHMLGKQDAWQRIRRKFEFYNITPERVAQVAAKITTGYAYQVKSIDQEIAQTVTQAVREPLMRAGGGAAILDSCLNLLRDQIPWMRGEE